MDKALLKHFLRRVVAEGNFLYVYGEGGFFCHITREYLHNEKQPRIEGNDLVYWDVQNNKFARFDTAKIFDIQF